MPVLQISNPFIALVDAILSSLTEVEPRWPPSEANDLHLRQMRLLSSCFKISSYILWEQSYREKEISSPPVVSQSCKCFSLTIISESTNGIWTFKVMLNRLYRTTKLFLRNPESIALVPQQERIKQVLANKQKKMSWKKHQLTPAMTVLSQRPQLMKICPS